MGKVQLTFAVVLCGGATGSDMTGNDVTGSDVPCPEVCSTHAQPKPYPP